LDEPIDSVFARLDVSQDGELDKAEVGQMLALLRAQATDAAADEDWLQPTEEEIASALREMDRDGSEGVSFQEFKAWWSRKNRDGEFAASPAMWGLQSSDEEDRLESHASKPSNDSGSLSTAVLNATPASSDTVVIDVADFEEHQDVVALFRDVDADGDGALQQSELATLLVRLRAKATGSAPEEEWLSPTVEEVSKAMEFMDLDGNGSVSIEEFIEWWDVKGGWDYAGDPSEWD
jgi:Ca2+-binding EF-hand superfamily protein